MDSLAHNTEQEFAFPHGTCRAFALQETGYDSTGTREEGGYYNDGSKRARQIEKESRAFLAAHPSYATSLTIERAQRSISVGLFQEMIENLRIAGYEAEDATHISLADQFHYFGVFVSPLWISTHSLAKVAAAYNTGSTKRTGRPYDKHIVQYQRKFSH